MKDSQITDSDVSHKTHATAVAEMSSTDFDRFRNNILGSSLENMNLYMLERG